MTRDLSPRQRAVLAAICDTFVPLGEGGGPTLHDRVARLVAGLPDPKDRGRLGFLLAALDSSLVNLALSGRARSFAALGQEARVAVLRGWANSGIQVRRAGFQAMKRLVNVVHYAWPADGSSHPMWRAVGYPGPLPALPEPPAPRLPAVEIAQEATLECVVVLEKGENLGPADFTQREGDMLQAAYLDGGMLMTQSASLPILAGSCVGGGTTINWTTSFPLREPTRAEWDAESGLSLFSGPRMAESFERVLARAGVNLENSIPGKRDEILQRGLEACGWHVDVIPRNVTGCHHGLECGYCGFGCRPNAKNSTAKTYLASAVAAGARILPRCEAERVLVERGRAAGVAARARMRDGRVVPVTVRAKTVIAACGAIHTPGLLARSGLTNANVGRNLHLHPVSGVLGFFRERVEPWSGNLQTRHSEQFANQDGRWYGAKFETGPVHFALPASAFGWEDPAQHRRDVGRLAHLGLVGILLRDREAGRVVTGRDGRPRAHYELSAYDAKHLRAAMLGAAQVLAAAGAEELATLQQPPARIRPGSPGWLDAFSASVDARGLDRCRMALISFHQMGTARMAADPRRGAVGETGESFEVRGLYVADGSAFVTSSGVNPMITIMAIADHVARGILERR